MKVLGAIVLIILLLAGAAPAVAQAPAGIFAPCAARDAYAWHAAPGLQWTGWNWIPVARLATLQVNPGAWEGYGSAAPFGGSYPDSGYWRDMVTVRTDCGEYQTWAWLNDNGWVTIFYFASLTANCDAAGNHCGHHDFQFYYAPVGEWARVVGR